MAKTKEERYEAYQKIIELIRENKISEQDAEDDALVFLYGLLDKDDKHKMSAAIAINGTPASITNIMIHLALKDDNPEFTKAMLIASANVLLEIDNAEAQSIGFLLGNYVDKNMSGIDCNCPTCLAKRERAKRNKTDVNVN